MKKIYLLLAAVMVTLSSFAAPKFVAPDMDIQLKDGALEQMQQAKFDFDQKINDGKHSPMRSWTDDNGVVWKAAILNHGGAWTLFSYEDGTNPTPEELPIYVVTLRVSDDSGKHDYKVDLCWPTQTIMYDTEEEAIAAVGEENLYNIAPIEWLYDIPFMYDPEYPLSYLGIMDPAYLGTTSTYNGEEGYVIGSGMSLTFTEYDKDLNWVDFSLVGNLEKNIVRNIAINYSGDAYIYGMEVGSRISFYPSQVHIFNTGILDLDSDWSWVYLADFEPVTRYYLMFAAEGYGYSDENGMPLELMYSDGTVAGTSFSATELPKELPYQLAEQTDVFHCGFGALFASENSELPYGRWTLPTGYVFDNSFNCMSPAIAYELLIGGYDRIQISVQDGMHVVDENFYYHNPQVGVTEWVIGDVNEGMRFTHYDNYGMLAEVQFKGDIFFHNNPEDYTQVELLPAVGTESYYQGSVDTSVENIAMPETEKINVKVVGNSIVAPEGAEVYNLNGVRVNANDLENGLYIVKVGKNAVKVVL